MPHSFGPPNKFDASGALFDIKILPDFTPESPGGVEAIRARFHFVHGSPFFQTKKLHASYLIDCVPAFGNIRYTRGRNPNSG